MMANLLFRKSMASGEKDDLAIDQNSVATPGQCVWIGQSSIGDKCGRYLTTQGI